VVCITKGASIEERPRKWAEDRTEEHNNRGLPAQNAITDPGEFDRLQNQAVDDFLAVFAPRTWIKAMLNRSAPCVAPS
jgi:hypothetical protein